MFLNEFEKNDCKNSLSFNFKCLFSFYTNQDKQLIDNYYVHWTLMEV